VHFKPFSKERPCIKYFHTYFSNCLLVLFEWLSHLRQMNHYQPTLLGQYAALTRSSLICWENNRTVDPSPENNRAAWYQGPMKLEVVKSCVVSDIVEYSSVEQDLKFVKCLCILPPWRIMLNAVEDLTSLCFRLHFRFDFTSRDRILFHSGTPDTTKGLGECVRYIGVPLFSEFPNCYYPLYQKPVSLVRSFHS